MNLVDFNKRPIVVAIVGPNGAGKTTFYYSYLASSGLRFVNPDLLAAELAIDAEDAAKLADSLRLALVARSESFVFETVFSDPVGDKVAFMEEIAAVGYEVVLCFIGLSNPAQCIERVAIRALQGGHDVPDEKLRSRFPRTLAKLGAAIFRLPHVLVYDNSDLSRPYYQLAVFNHGRIEYCDQSIP